MYLISRIYLVALTGTAAGAGVGSVGVTAGVVSLGKLS